MRGKNEPRTALSDVAQALGYGQPDKYDNHIQMYNGACIGLPQEVLDRIYSLEATK